MRRDDAWGRLQDDTFVGQQRAEALLQVEHAAAVLRDLVDQIRARDGRVGLRGEQEEDGDHPQVMALLAGVAAFAAVSNGDLGELDAGADQARGQADVEGGMIQEVA